MAVFVGSKGLADRFSGWRGLGAACRTGKSTEAGPKEKVIGSGPTAVSLGAGLTQDVVLSQPATRNRSFEFGAARRISGSAGSGAPDPRLT